MRPAAHGSPGMGFCAEGCDSLGVCVLQEGAGAGRLRGRAGACHRPAALPEGAEGPPFLPHMALGDVPLWRTSTGQAPSASERLPALQSMEALLRRIYYTICSVI